MRTGINYMFYTLIAVVFSFLLHELTHWSVGELLGYDMGMSLNKAYPLSGQFNSEADYTLVSAVGPAITLVQSFVFFFIIRKTKQPNFYPFLFAGFYLELLSGIMNFSRANDLGRISRTVHLGLFTIPAIIVAIHFLLVYKTSVREKYTMKFNLCTLLWVLVFSSVWVLVNQKFNIVII